MVQQTVRLDVQPLVQAWFRGPEDALTLWLRRAAAGVERARCLVHFGQRPRPFFPPLLIPDCPVLALALPQLAASPQPYPQQAEPFRAEALA